MLDKARHVIYTYSHCGPAISQVIPNGDREEAIYSRFSGWIPMVVSHNGLVKVLPIKIRVTKIINNFKLIESKSEAVRMTSANSWHLKAPG